ncbi:MAG: SRPBCC domain-containing protein, partial [Chloroflexi bacterium]|nr:SRPBCC domain-containing protein [Chloroflexota bacterium]
YREIGPVERLVKTESMADAEGTVVDIGMPGMPLETLVTLKLEEEGKSRTRMTLWHAGLPEGDHRSHAGEGYRQAFEKFAAVLEKEREKTGKGNPS